MKNIYIHVEKKSLHIFIGHMYNLLLICITPLLQLFSMDKLHYQNPLRENFSCDLWAEIPLQQHYLRPWKPVIIFNYLNDIKLAENIPFCSFYGTLQRNSQVSSFQIVLRCLMNRGAQVTYQLWPTRTKTQIFVNK